MQHTASLTGISVSVVWAVCHIGMSAEVLRSTELAGHAGPVP